MPPPVVLNPTARKKGRKRTQRDGVEGFELWLTGRSLGEQEQTTNSFLTALFSVVAWYSRKRVVQSHPGLEEGLLHSISSFNVLEHLADVDVYKVP